MSTVIHKRRRLYRVVRISELGRVEHDWVEKKAFSTSMTAPVTWNGEVAELHLWNYKKKTSVNQQATDLFNREGFVIRGTVLILLGSDMFYAQKTAGRRRVVEANLANIGLTEEPVIIEARDYYPHQNVYSRDRNDAFAIRMRLP